MKLTKLSAAAVLLAAAAVTGCSKPPPPIVPAEGTVLLNGQPLPGVMVQFVPTAEGIGSDYIATGMTDDNGHFTLICKGQPGAAACATVVVINEGPMPDNVRGNQNAEAKHQKSLKNRPVPGKYFSTSKNPLTINVTPDQGNYELKLER